MERFSLLFALVLGSAAQAQNLVPNGSFEEYSECPPYFGYSFLATGWGGPGGVWFNSPDYFNACDETNVVGVPSSQFGYQYASDGQAYMGMFTTRIGGVPWWRELIGTQLSEPLQAGVPVCLSFKMAVGGFGSFSGSSALYTCKNFGVKFFVEPPTDWQSYLYPNSAALRMEEVPTDTALWYYASDVYVPDSDYVYLVLGNFYADSLSDVTVLDTGGSGLEMAYAFVDDVRVSFDLEYCDSQNFVDQTALIRPIVYPNPVAGSLQLVLPNSVGWAAASIYDIAGRISGQHHITSWPEGRTLDVSSLPEGVYVLHVTDGVHSFAPVRFGHVAY